MAELKIMSVQLLDIAKMLAGFLGGYFAPKGEGRRKLLLRMPPTHAVLFLAVLRITCGIFGFALPPERPASKGTLG